MMANARGRSCVSPPSEDENPEVPFNYKLGGPGGGFRKTEVKFLNYYTKDRVSCPFIKNQIVRKEQMLEEDIDYLQILVNDRVRKPWHNEMLLKHFDFIAQKNQNGADDSINVGVTMKTRSNPSENKRKRKSVKVGGSLNAWNISPFLDKIIEKNQNSNLNYVVLYCNCAG